MLTAVAGAGAKVAPGVARTADDVFTGGVKWIRDTLHTPMSVDPVLVPQGGPSLPGVPGQKSVDDLNMYSKSAEEVGRAQQINETVGTPRKDEIANAGWYTRAEFRQQVHESKWTNYDDKHLKAKTEEQAKLFSLQGTRGKEPAAQYLPGQNTKVMEKDAMWGAVRNGHFVREKGTYYFYHKFDRVIGYNEGKPTRWMRVELGDNPSADYHGFPANLDQVKKVVPGAKE